jgi:hypothetical protein
MDLLQPWLVFPLLLLAVLLGCGLLVRALTGAAIPGPLLPGVGLATLICVASLTTGTEATAKLTTPVVVALAAVGYISAWPLDWRRAARSAPVPAAAGAAVFLAYGAPILLSGEPTIAGFIKLDDTATWLALTDRVMQHGRDLAGLAPSTYYETLHFNLGAGYPVGAFLPLGVGSQLAGSDPAWTIQAYMSLLGGLLAVSMTEIARPLVPSGPVRAAVAFVAAQPALLVGYVLWGGIKEIEAASLIALSAALVPAGLDQRRGAASVVPLSLSVAALLLVLSPGGGIWLLAILGVPLLILWRRSPAAAVTAAGVIGAIAVVFLLPLMSGGKLVPPTSEPLTSANAKGNLIHPLSGWQAFGIWPVGDFRLRPDQGAVTALAIAVTAALGAVGTVLAARRRALAPLLYVASTVVGAAALVLIGSPWVDGKALATASPAFLFAAGLGIALLYGGGMRIQAALAAVIVAGGVLTSNVLGYRDVNLAPHGQFVELERIGHRIDGEGPTLMTEYSPYGARHFLRDADPESASELRRRPDTLRTGEELKKGFSADTDEFRLGSIMQYRTLVLRRSPAQSRPPEPYQLTYRGRYYDVWQRPPGSQGAVIAHLPLGIDVDPASVPACDRVRDLAASAGPGDLLAAVSRGPVGALGLAGATYPSEWAEGASAGFPEPRDEGQLSGVVAWPGPPGPVDVWLGGSVRGGLTATINGAESATVRHELNNYGQYVFLGQANALAGPNQLTLDYSGPDLHPGSEGGGFPIGPAVLSPAHESLAVSRFSPDDAGSLCGHRWDWIELVRG